jgi:hypothetical protein
MSENFNLNEEVKNTKKRFSRLGNLTANKYFNRKIILPLLILAAIPLTVGLVFVQQETRSRASEVLYISSVGIHPGSVEVNIETPPAPVEMSALAFNAYGEPVDYGVTYEWSISSENEVGTLTNTQGHLTQFKGLNYGCGIITVVARRGNQTVTKSAVVAVFKGSDRPSCGQASNSLNINTPNVTLDAEDFYLIVDGKKYTAKNAKISATSDSGSETTTLKSNWIEDDGTPIILNAIFRRDPTNKARFEIVAFVASNDGNPQGNITFVGSRNWGNFGNYGYPAFWQNIDLTSSSNNSLDVSKLHFGNVTIFPFKLYSAEPTPTFTPTPTPTAPPPSGIVTSVKLSPTADAFVRSSAPTTNFGKQTSLRTDQSPTEVSYLKFNLASLKGRTIKKATLVLKVNQQSGAAQTVRRADDSSWSETGITYNKRPKFTNSVNAFIPRPSGKVIQVDVLGPVRNKAGQNLTLGITSGGNEASFYSKEAANSSNRPQLVVEYQ